MKKNNVAVSASESAPDSGWLVPKKLYVWAVSVIVVFVLCLVVIIVSAINWTSSKKGCEEFARNQILSFETGYYDGGKNYFETGYCDGGKDYCWPYTYPDGKYGSLEGWCIRFTSDSDSYNSVTFSDKSLYDKIELLFGKDCIDPDNVIYVYPRNRYSICFKKMVKDGISMISYNPGTDDLRVTKYGDREKGSDDLKNELEKSGILEQLQKDNEKLNATLKENGIDLKILEDISPDLFSFDTPNPTAWRS